MKFKYFLAILCTSLIVGIGVSAAEVENSKVLNNREEDLKVILDGSFLKEERFDKLASIYASQVIDKNDKKLPVELVVSRLRQAILTQESLKQLMQPYDVFSDDEIHQIRQFFENKVFVKYVMDQSFPIVKSNIQVMENLLTKIVQENIEISEKASEEVVESSEGNDQEINNQIEREIIELTEDNFHEEVEQSGKPIIVDVYANWCRPCRAFSSTFEDLHEKYKHECRFAKVNSENEALIVNFLKVSAYPTTVFIHKGKVVSREVGNMSKKDLEAKIQDFIQNLE